MKNDEQLLQFNQRLITQAFEVISAINLRSSKITDYEKYVGPHLRHILEHYQALVKSVNNNKINIDYDARVRDRTLEKDSEKMIFALKEIQNTLLSWGNKDFNQTLTINLQGGMLGEDDFACNSTLARELMFLASHTIHHFALIQVWCFTQGISLAQDFGKAPSTIAFERSN